MGFNTAGVSADCESAGMDHTIEGFSWRWRRLVASAVLVMLSVLIPSSAIGAGGASESPSRTSADAAPGFPWAWPVDGARTVTEPFRAPAHDYGPGHRGMDVAAEPDAVVRSPAAGVVAFRGTVADRPLITIDHGGGYVSTLEPVASDLRAGAAVTAGDAVGVVASGGHAARGTLHVGVRVEGRYVNPRGLFGGMPRAVLLPCCTG